MSEIDFYEKCQKNEVYIKSEDIAEEDMGRVEERIGSEKEYLLEDLIIYGCCVSVRKYYEQSGADVNASIGVTKPLHASLCFGYKNNEMTNMLLDMGADVNGLDHTFPAVCATENHEEIIPRLLEAGAKDIVGGIMEAVEEGFTEYLDILLPLVPDVNNLIDRKGEPVDLLSISPRKSMTSYLIAHGVRPKNETEETE